MTRRAFDHYDVVLFGTLRSSDSWSCSLEFAHLDLSPIGTGGITNVTAIANAVDTAVAANITTSNAHGIGLSASGQYLGNNVYFRQAGNSSASAVGQTLRTITGSNTASSPNQVAIVNSLLTPRAGRSQRGRIYWPWLASTGTLTGTNVTNMATETAALITALNTSISTIESVLSSCVVGIGGTAVNRVKVDDVLDTQRRRRDKQVAVNKSTHTV